MTASRPPSLGRWLLALLLLALLAWGVGELRSGPAEPELGVGDLRGDGATAAAVPAEGDEATPPAGEPPRLPAAEAPLAPPAPTDAETRTGER